MLTANNTSKTAKIIKGDTIDKNKDGGGMERGSLSQ